MSYTLINSLKNSDNSHVKNLRPSQYAVLIYLAECINDMQVKKGVPYAKCWPSIKKICEKTRYKATAVKDAIRDMCDLGIMSKGDQRTRNDGSHSTMEYILHIKDLINFQPKTTPTSRETSDLNLEPIQDTNNNNGKLKKVTKKVITKRFKEAFRVIQAVIASKRGFVLSFKRNLKDFMTYNEARMEWDYKQTGVDVPFLTVSHLDACIERWNQHILRSL